MKVSQPSAKMGRKPFVPPPIPLERPAIKELKKQEYLVMKLRSDPADANSQTYDLTIQFFRTGTPEEWLLFQRDLNRVFTAQNITTVPQKLTMIRLLITGDTLAVFNNDAAEHGYDTNATFLHCLQDVTNHIFPQRALSFQKRYMRRYLRKPKEMSTREFAARISELNQYLKQFPPFEDNQEIDDEEIIDIIEFGIPSSWQKNMVLQGFDPMESTLADLVAFCERHEFTESNLDKNDNDNTKNKGKNSNDLDQKPPAKGGNVKVSNKRSDKFCDLHQSYGHSTAECKVVQAQIKKMRSNYETGQNAGKKYPSKETKATVMSLVEKSVKASMKKLMNNNKKRKLSETNFNIETSEKEGETFDIDDFEDLVLSSDEEDS